MHDVKIPYDLFISLLDYHLLDDTSQAKGIESGLERKVKTMVDHELYTKYKQAPTLEERERARGKYLDNRGVRHSFRW